MGRMIIGGVVVAIIAIIAVYVISVKDEEARKAQESKIVELQGQLQKLQDENNGLKSALAKVQSEEDRLAAGYRVSAQLLVLFLVGGRQHEALPFEQMA